MGIIHGDAPPFILLALSWTISTAVLAYVLWAVRNPEIRRGAGVFVPVYFCAAMTLQMLLLVRITTGAILSAGEGEAFFWTLDILIISSLALVMGSPWFFFVFRYRLLLESNMLQTYLPKAIDGSPSEPQDTEAAERPKEAQTEQVEGVEAGGEPDSSTALPTDATQ